MSLGSLDPVNPDKSLSTPIDSYTSKIESTKLNTDKSSGSGERPSVNPKAGDSVGGPATEEKKEKAKESFATGALRRFDQAGDSFVASVVTAVPRFIGAAVFTALSVPAAVAGLTLSVASLFTDNAKVGNRAKDLMKFTRDSFGHGLTAMLYTPVDLVMSTVRFLTSWAISPEIKVAEDLVQSTNKKVDNTPNDVMKHVHKVVSGLTFTPVYVTSLRSNIKGMRFSRPENPLLGRVRNLLIYGTPKTTKEMKDNDGNKKTASNFLNRSYRDVASFAVENIFTTKGRYKGD